MCDTAVETLQRWYAARCDGQWEHGAGVEIACIDNPGWRVRIDGASARPPLTLEREDGDDWLRVNADATGFLAYGGAGNLLEILGLAAQWLQAGPEAGS